MNARSTQQASDVRATARGGAAGDLPSTRPLSVINVRYSPRQYSRIWEQTVREKAIPTGVAMQSSPRRVGIGPSDGSRRARVIDVGRPGVLIGTTKTGTGSTTIRATSWCSVVAATWWLMADLRCCWQGTERVSTA